MRPRHFSGAARRRAHRRTQGRSEWERTEAAAGSLLEAEQAAAEENPAEAALGVACQLMEEPVALAFVGHHESWLAHDRKRPPAAGADAAGARSTALPAPVHACACSADALSFTHT